MKYNIDLYSSIPPKFLEAALFVEKTFQKHGYEIFLVGGSVRDLLLHKKISDLDFTTNAKPQQVQKMFKSVIPVGIDFGTVIVLYKKIPMEVTTYRTETEYQDGRHPTKIQFGTSLQEDVKRRDFTVNGLAYSLSEKTIYDFCEGMADIQNRRLQTIGLAQERFREDGLRPIRACRFSASNGFVLQKEIFEAIAKTKDIIASVAPERFHDEWRKSLKAEKPQLFWQQLFETKIFNIFFNDLQNLQREVERQNFLLRVLSEKKNKTVYYNCASLWFCEWYALQQYPLTSKNKNDLQHEKNFSFGLYFSDEPIEQEKRKKLLKNFFARQRFPKAESDLTKELLFSPLLDLIALTINRSTLQADIFFNELELKTALAQIKKEKIFVHLSFYGFLLPHFFPQQKKQLQHYKKSLVKNLRNILRQPKYIGDLNINGDDLKSQGYNGKQIGEQLKKLQQHVLKNPQDNQKEILLQLAQNKTTKN